MSSEVQSPLCICGGGHDEEVSSVKMRFEINMKKWMRPYQRNEKLPYLGSTSNLGLLTFVTHHPLLKVKHFRFGRDQLFKYTTLCHNHSKPDRFLTQYAQHQLTANPSQPSQIAPLDTNQLCKFRGGYFSVKYLSVSILTGIQTMLVEQ